STWLLVQTFPGTSLTSATFTPTAPAPLVSVLSDPAGGKQGLASYDVTAAGLGLDGLDWTDPAGLVQAVEGGQKTVLAAAANLGLQQQLLSNDQAEAGQKRDLLDVGVGHLVDADLEREGASLQAAEVKRSLAVQALAIANASPRALLSLYR